jgi:hypothetical protein
MILLGALLNLLRDVDPEQFINTWKVKALNFIEIASTISSDAVGALPILVDPKSKEKARLLGSLRISRVADLSSSLPYAPSPQRMTSLSALPSPQIISTPQESQRTISPKLASSSGIISTATNSMSALLASTPSDLKIESTNMTKILFPVVDFLMDNQEKILHFLRFLRVQNLRKDLQGEFEN